jgi:hypothetical protein
VTRVEIALRLAIGIVGASAVLAGIAALTPRQEPRDFSAAVALVFVVFPHFIGWVFLSRLIRGKPGFPFVLLYTRPVRTEVMVGLPMAYLTAVPVAIYLVSALLLRVISGYPFPLLSVAAWIAALNLVYLAINWSTRNLVFVTLAAMLAAMHWLGLAINRLTAEEIPDNYDWPPYLWPTRFDIPPTDYVVIGAIALASFAVAVIRVARQRHGVARAAKPRKVASSRFPKWLEDLLRSCPTSSATRAQIWFELRSSGIWLLAIGLAIAALTPLVYLVAKPELAVTWTMFSVLAALFVGTNSGFGTQIKKGTLERSDFEATLPVGSARLAGLKVIVRSVCVLAVLIPLVASAWGARSYIAPGPGPEPWRSLNRAIVAVRALTGYEHVALAVVAVIGFVAMGAWHPAFWVLWTRYSRRVKIVTPLLLLYGVALVWLAVGVRVDPRTASQFHLDVVHRAMGWIAAAAIVFTTVYLFWSAFTERLLTLRYVCGALLVSLIFGVAWVTLLRAAGVQLAGMRITDVAWSLSPVLLTMMASVLAPWSLNRIRHT